MPWPQHGAAKKLCRAAEWVDEDRLSPPFGVVIAKNGEDLTRTVKFAIAATTNLAM
jgi:hypothetical protein